jgi:hypothetical protein
MTLFNFPTFLPLGLRYPLGVLPAPISDIGPVGPVRHGGELLAAGLPLPALAVLEDVLAAGAGELCAWLVR